jgi:NADH:ubiquinone oxidoreductase subunit K
VSLAGALYLSAAIFCVGVYGVLSRQNLIILLMSLELLLNAVNLAIVALGRAFLVSAPDDPSGPHVFVVIVLAVAAAEAAVGLSILLAVYRKWRSTNAGEIDMLRG